jgi:hypothetical protein
VITVDELIRRLEEMKDSQDVSGETPVIIDCGEWLAEVEDVDLGGSDEGVIIWCGDRVED